MLAFFSLIVAISIPFASAAAKNEKRGVAFPASNNPTDVKNFNQSGSAITWVYDWGLDVPDYLRTSKLEYIPMQWGAEGIEKFAERVKAQRAKTILAFNEPDFASQSNMDPEFAAQLWMKYIQPLKQDGVRLGGPAVTGSGSGQPWLTLFFNACRNCTIDFLPLHWYGTGMEGFYDYIYQVHAEYPKIPLWVTEWADTSLNRTDVMQFMNETTKFMDDRDFIERYAWFGYFRPENTSAYNFLEADGSLNQLGQVYIGANTVERSGPARDAAAVTAPQGGPSVPLKTATVGTAIYHPTSNANSATQVELLGGAQLLLALFATLSGCVAGITFTLW